MFPSGILAKRDLFRNFCLPLSIVIGLRICQAAYQGEIATKKTWLEELKQDLISRKYHVKIIDEAFDKVKKISRKEALEKVHNVKGLKQPL